MGMAVICVVLAENTLLGFTVKISTLTASPVRDRKCKAALQASRPLGVGKSLFKHRECATPFPQPRADPPPSADTAGPGLRLRTRVPCETVPSVNFTRETQPWPTVSALTACPDCPHTQKQKQKPPPMQGQRGVRGVRGAAPSRAPFPAGGEPRRERARGGQAPGWKENQLPPGLRVRGGQRSMHAHSANREKLVRERIHQSSCKTNLGM